MSRRTTQDGWPGFLLLAALSCCALYVLVRSFSWPLLHDAPVLNYVGRRVLSGDIPYRDVFDMSMPGTYLAHMLAVSAFGSGDLAWRLFDLAWLALAVVSIIVVCRPYNKAVAFTGALFFVAFHLGNGPSSMGQRDFLMVPLLLLGGHLVARFLETQGRTHYLFVAGLMLGAATSIKPTALALVGCLALLLAASTYGAPGKCVRAVAVLAMGVAVPLLAVLGWLWIIGALSSFWFLFADYLPLYTRLQRAGYPDQLTAIGTGLPLYGLILVPLLLLWFRGASLRRPRTVVLILGVLYGLIHFVSQGKAWWYHLYPLQGFVLVLIAVMLDELRSRGRTALRVAAHVFLLLMCLRLGAWCIQMGRTNQALAVSNPLVEQLVEDLSAHGLSERDTVQVMDTTEGGIHALYLLGIRLPTRFIYDYHFFHDVEHPVVVGLRSEFVEDLRRERPRLIVVLHETWLPTAGVERIASFEELSALLEGRYVRHTVRPGFTVNGGYTIYAAK